MSEYLDFKTAKCKNCYKCLKYCPVKAIKIENNQAKIIEDRCILCGKCTLVCPQNAKEVHSETDRVKQLLANHEVIATVAPSFISNFNISSFEALNRALKNIGFIFAEETARGAKKVSEKYEELLKTGRYKNFITSCCPSANRMISLYFPQAIKYLAPVDSPVIAHAKMLKEEYPNCKIVFIGPCIAKKKECKESGIIDCVLTFEELSELLEENNVDLEELDNQERVNWNKARFYPINRGIIKSFDALTEDYEYIAIDGVDRCKEVLSETENLEHVFLEINTCPSSCINGPCRINQKMNSVAANAKVRKYVGNNQGISKQAKPEKQTKIKIDCIHKQINFKDKVPTEAEIKEVLAKTGKYKAEDELNCGACGYSSCREKAWAVINGYADIEMCLPYMRDRAENVSDEIIKSSPNGIAVIDSEFKIIDINDKAKSILGVNSIRLKEDYCFDYFEDVEDFVNAILEKKNIHRKQIEIKKTNTYVELSITHMKTHNMIFAIMKDITEEVRYDSELQKVKLETIATTDEVIKKQMRTAQEIASLLGETTAETKVALVNLKKILKDEEGN